MKQLVFLFCVIGLSHGTQLNVQPRFIFSASSASYQVEGAWNESGKGENIWDRITHTNPEFVVGRANGDVACDSYHKFHEDVQLLKHVGFQMYRFSISWSRILPTGKTDHINQAGIDFYDSFIDTLLANGIEPMVTLYHWDLPQPLQDEQGGWLNPKIVDYFVDYARIIFQHFGNKVQYWITINEPQEVTKGYGSTEYAPAMNLKGTGEYVAGHHLILAHAKAYRMYQQEFSHLHNGKLSMSINGAMCIPLTNSTENIEAAERANLFSYGWFANPVYSKDGNYPDVMRQIIDANSISEGRPHSRLPTFSAEEVELVKGTFDFFGFNHYSSLLCSDRQSKNGTPSWSYDVKVDMTFDPRWPGSASDWLKVYPDGFRKALNWIKQSYGDVPIFVTENGYSDFQILNDTDRINYHQSYLKAMVDAITEDQVPVIGYTVWSILDNFEWRRGYSENFGIYHVNFTDPLRPRMPKASVEYFRQIIPEYSSKILHPYSNTIVETLQ